MTDEELTSLATGIRDGDRRALAKAITLAESTRDDHRSLSNEILETLLPETGKSIRIGISGPPGVGKSTFIEAFGLHVVNAGHKLAVLAVDPSSQRTGGSILGDKTRMVELSRHPDAFIRPSPGGDQLGGVARRTREAMLLCEAAGAEVVIIETIGVGQSEIAVAEMVDIFVLLVAPGGGDDLQGIKRGIMELADLIIVNKADGDLAAAARRTAADYGHAVKLLRPSHRAWKPEVHACSALDGTGINNVWSAVERFHKAITESGELKAHRSEQAKAWMWSEVQDTLLRHAFSDPSFRQLASSVEEDVSSGHISSTRGASILLKKLSGQQENQSQL